MLARVYIKKHKSQFEILVQKKKRAYLEEKLKANTKNSQNIPGNPSFAK